MSDPRINALQQMQTLKDRATTPLRPSGAQSEVSFQEMMKQYLNEANNMQVQADQDIRKMIAGEEIDAHKVMMAVEKANLSFELVMEIRNKMLDAYREIIKQPV